MKEDNRVTLHCRRILKHGIVDAFDVTVSKEKAQEMKEYYKGMGYEVK